MLGLLLIYFIGKYFYDLAIKYAQSKWGYAILGVIMYYAGAFMGGILIGIFMELTGSNVAGTNDFVLGLIALPFGLLTCWLFYKFLEKRWSGAVIPGTNSDILDEGMGEL